MGTNTDPYQRAEGRYRLMPGIIEALARSGTPFSLLTKGTVLTRDLPLLTAAAARRARSGSACRSRCVDRGAAGRGSSRAPRRRPPGSTSCAGSPTPGCRAG